MSDWDYQRIQSQLADMTDEQLHQLIADAHIQLDTNRQNERISGFWLCALVILGIVVAFLL